MTTPTEFPWSTETDGEMPDDFPTDNYEEPAQPRLKTLPPYATISFYLLVAAEVIAMVAQALAQDSWGTWLRGQEIRDVSRDWVVISGALPILVLAGLIGVLVDRHRRKPILMASYFGQAFFTLVLAALVATNYAQMWHYYLVVAVQALLTIVRLLALQASVPMLLPYRFLNRANATVLLITTMSSLLALGLFTVSPEILWFDRTTFDTSSWLMIHMGTLLVAGLIVSGVRIPRREQPDLDEQPPGSFLEEYRENFLFLADHKGLFTLIVGFATAYVVMYIASSMADSYLAELKDGTTGTWSKLNLLKTGSIFAGLGFIMIGRLPNRRSLFALQALLISAGCMAVIGVIQNWTIAVGLMALMNFLFWMGFALLWSTIQRKTPSDMYGQVFGFLQQLIVLVLPVMYWITRPAMDHIFKPLAGSGANDPNRAYFVFSGILAFAVALYVFQQQSVQSLEDEETDYIPGREPEDDETRTVHDSVWIIHHVLIRMVILLTAIYLIAPCALYIVRVLELGINEPISDVARLVSDYLSVPLAFAYAMLAVSFTVQLSRLGTRWLTR